MTRAALLSLAFASHLFGCSSAPDDENGVDPPGEITLIVTSPQPGAELVAAEDPVITVTGTVSSTSAAGVLELWVNGERVTVDPGGAFLVELSPVLGINHVAVEGRDGISEPVERRMDVMWAPDYLPPLPGTTGFDLAGAFELRLGQRLFDARLSGSDLDLQADPVVARDLASVVELVLWHMDLAGLLEDGLQFGGGDSYLDVDIPSADKLGVVVDARILDDPELGLDLFIDLYGVYLAMEGEFGFGGDVWAIEGGIVADMHASARVLLELSAEGAVEAWVTDVAATVGPLMPMFEGPDGAELNAFITLSEGDFRALVEGLIAQELIPTFTDGLPSLFQTLLGALDAVLSDVSFELDTGLGDAPVTVHLDGHIGTLEVVAGPPIGTAPGHMTVRQDLSIRTSGEPIHPGSRGAVRTDAMPAPPFSDAAGLNLAVRQDFLNALLHALWNGGLLEGEVEFGGLSAVVSARLPPAVRATPPSSPCRVDGERCDVILQLGQIEVELPDFLQRFVLSATAGARITADGGAISLAIQDLPTLRVWEISEEPGVLSNEAMHDLVINLVWPRLFGALGDNLTIPLPLPDLADLGLDQVAPAIADAALELEVRQRTSVMSGFLGLAADLVLEAPQP